MAQDGSRKLKRQEAEIAAVLRDMFGPYPQRPRRSPRRKRPPRPKRAPRPKA